MKNKILVYDDNCPLCSWYSGLFVRYGLLTAEGRKSFSDLDPFIITRINIERGRNEIPLLDTDSGDVSYGIDALLNILGERFPFIKKIGSIQPVYWFLKRFYRFISYNRKVIVARRCNAGAFDCAPDINYFYRLLFMGIFLAFNTLMLFPLHTYVLTDLTYYHLSINNLQTAHFLLVSINCLVALSFKKEKALEYLGQVNMLALTSILLLTPLILFSFLGLKEWMVTGWLLSSTIIIFKEYLRRMDYAGVINTNRWVASVNLASIAGFLMFLFR